MIYTTAIKEQFNILEPLGDELIALLSATPDILKSRNSISILEQHTQLIDTSFKQYTVHLKELKNIVNSTLFSSLSNLLSNTDNLELQKQYEKIKQTTFKIGIKNRENEALLKECIKVVDFNINLIFNRRLEPTNYKIDNINLHKQQLNQFKNR